MIKTKKDKLATENFVYGVVSRSENRVLERMEKLEKKMDDRFNKVINHLVGLAKQFKKFDEEQTVLSGSVSNHGDRIEKLEKAVFKS